MFLEYLTNLFNIFQNVHNQYFDDYRILINEMYSIESRRQFTDLIEQSLKQNKKKNIEKIEKFKNHVSGFEKMSIDELYIGINEIIGENRKAFTNGADILEKINKDIKPIFDYLCIFISELIIKNNAIKGYHCEIFTNDNIPIFFKFLMIFKIDNDYIEALKSTHSIHLTDLKVSAKIKTMIGFLIKNLEDNIESIKSMIINIDPLSIMEIYKHSMINARKIMVGDSGKTLFDSMYEEYVINYKQSAMSEQDKTDFINSLLNQT